MLALAALSGRKLAENNFYIYPNKTCQSMTLPRYGVVGAQTSDIRELAKMNNFFQNLLYNALNAVSSSFMLFFANDAIYKFSLLNVRL